MTNLVPLDKVVNLLKNIIDGIRCPICDRSTGDRARYHCGHIICDDCSLLAEGCVLCLTPPTTSALIIDKPFSKRIKSANSLLNACQKTFNIDVYKRHRISEQLKLEKQLFPDCIQAPLKYCNKRKSFLSNSNKENSFSLILPGEQISSPKHFKMKRYKSSVQQWLNKNEPYSRKVFSELNVNQQQGYNNLVTKVDNNIQRGNKRNHSFSPVRQAKYTANKRNKNSLAETNTHLKNKEQKKCDHEESGIFLDDEPIYIEDSQSNLFDKDKLALLAVEQADMSESLLPKSPEQRQDKKSQRDNVLKEKFNFFNSDNIKVPFYKKGSLKENCIHCDGVNVFNNTSYTKDSKNVSILIENSNFITTINISNYVENQLTNSSVSVQTDNNDLIKSDEIAIGESDFMKLENSASRNIKPNVIEKQNDMSVFDNFEMKPNSFDIKDKLIDIPESRELHKKTIVIDDSDSDTTNEESSLLHVSADVHKSCDADDYGVLNQVHTDQSICRPRIKARGATPDSSNSSDKENCDPNKIKKSGRVGSKKIKSAKK